jgi:hypothetical protein
MRPEPIKPKKSFTIQQRKWWERLNTYIRNNDGWTTSEPGTSLIRFETRVDSSLPELLRSAGHDVRDAGVAERLMPITETLKQHGGNITVTREHIAPQQVLIFEFRLPE